MSREDYQREMNYELRMAVARTMLRSGIISADEFSAIDTIMLAKYRPKIGGLCVKN